MEVSYRKMPNGVDDVTRYLGLIFKIFKNILRIKDFQQKCLQFAPNYSKIVTD